jgi:hypothetical protein
MQRNARGASAARSRLHPIQGVARKLTLPPTLGENGPASRRVAPIHRPAANDGATTTTVHAGARVVLGPRREPPLRTRSCTRASPSRRRTRRRAGRPRSRQGNGPPRAVRTITSSPKRPPARSRPRVGSDRPTTGAPSAKKQPVTNSRHTPRPLLHCRTESAQMSVFGQPERAMFARRL